MAPNYTISPSNFQLLRTSTDTAILRHRTMLFGILGIQSRLAAAVCTVFGNLCFTRTSPHMPSAHRSGGGDAVSRDAKCAEEASLRRVAAQIAQQSSARAKRSGRKEPRMRSGISARTRGTARRAERAAHEGKDPRNSAAPQRRMDGSLSKGKKMRFCDAVRYVRFGGGNLTGDWV